MNSKYKYSTLYNKLKDRISSGRYPSGEKLPTESALMKEFTLSRQTVRQALSCLENEGFIVKRQGSGSIVKEPGDLPLRERSNTTIAVITTYISEYIFPDILRAIVDYLSDRAYQTMIFATRNRVDNERKILNGLLDQPLAGLIIEGTKSALPNPNIDLYREFERRQVPIVFIHATYPELTNTACVVADDKQGGKIATNYLIAKGHKKIAGIFKSDDLQGHLRYAGYTESMRENNLTITDNNVLWYTTESSELIADFGLRTIENCTALLCYNDEIALKMLNLLRENDIRIPEDISIISFDNSTYSELSTPKISSCSQRKRQIGALSAKKLLNLIHGIEQESSMIKWRIIEKESIKNIT